MIANIYDKLKIEGLNPYFIGQHKGECDKSFLIIREGNQLPSIGSNQTGQQILDIILFVPARSYIQMNPYRDKVKAALKELSYLRKTGLETPTIADDEKKAYTMSIEYTLQLKLEG